MIITESQFKKDSSEKSLSVLLERAIYPILSKDCIFLSHKHSEKVYVFRLKSILERYGFDGYVDWEDEEMPAFTSGQTALQIKEKITKSKKFILIATEKAISSKWCNWETGFADAHKFINNIALFPIKIDDQNYSGGEYLQIYPSIQVSYSFLGEAEFNYYVEYPDGNKISLDKWLNL